MTVQFTIPFSSFLVENQYLVTFYQRRQYFAYHFGPFYRGSTYFHFATVVYQQYFFKLNNSATLCALDVMNEQFLSFFYLELLSINFYNYVHLFFSL